MGFGPFWLDSKAALTFITWFRQVKAWFFWSTAFFREDTLQVSEEKETLNNTDGKNCLRNPYAKDR